MKNWIYTALIALFAGGIAACSEDDITLDPTLSASPYELPRGEEGSLEELIYSFHERYGVYILYDVTEKEVNTSWSGTYYYGIVPVDVEKYRDCMVELITFLMDNVFATYPDEFIGELLPRRIFLVDTLLDGDNEISMVTLENHSLAIAGVGEKMTAFTEADWANFNIELIGNVFGNLTVPREFYDLINPQDNEWWLAGFGQSEEDPEGEYDDFHYAVYKCGCLDAIDQGILGLFRLPSETDDLVDYVLFLMSTPATEIEKLCERFEAIENRARVLVQSLLTDQEVDLVAIQNATCPNDPLPVDYFD